MHITKSATSAVYEHTVQRIEYIHAAPQLPPPSGSVTLSSRKPEAVPAQHLPAPLPQPQGAPIVSSVSVVLTAPSASSKWHHTAFVFFCDWLMSPGVVSSQSTLHLMARFPSVFCFLLLLFIYF